MYTNEYSRQIANLQKLLKGIPDSDTESISAIIKQMDNIRRREQIGGKKKSRGKMNKRCNNNKNKSRKNNKNNKNNKKN